jgi:hypothetical protein
MDEIREYCERKTQGELRRKSRLKKVTTADPREKAVRTAALEGSEPE